MSANQVEVYKVLTSEGPTDDPGATAERLMAANSLTDLYQQLAEHSAKPSDTQAAHVKIELVGVVTIPFSVPAR